ncbi:MAG: tail fiber domain-containing protein [Chitinophagaceae bacterium]|nr:tail fiber domain-containing protein [Chitinophagaceae bacterium]
MKKALVLLFFCSYTILSNAQIGNVGINTKTPLALLHVNDSSVLFTGPSTLPASPGNPPISGAGTRMMWYPAKAAFRVGRVLGTEWDKSNLGTNSFASGVGTIASGNLSVAMGDANIASGASSTAMGSGTLASGISSTAIGDLTRATGENSTAMGSSTTASGQSATAMGFGNISSGFHSTAMGSGTLSTGSHTTTMGLNTTARAHGSLTIGQFNDSIINSSPTSWIATDPVFIIGNGSSIFNRSNAITVLKNSKTGINTSTPLAALHIVALDNSFDQSIRLESTLGTTSFCNLLYDGSLKFRTSDATATYQWRDNTNNTRMTLTSSGNLLIDGVLTQSSDIRLKKNIAPLQNSLDKIALLNGYQYNWIDASRGNALQSGVLAQEVEKQMPELVSTDAEGDKSVNYNGLIPYLIESVKDLKQQIQELKKENEILRAKKQ